jgi:CHAT domain-containing protein/tetratricopeptide (TPR) repeat protein
VSKRVERTAYSENAIGELAQLADAKSREEFFRHHRRLLRPRTVERLAEIVREKVRVNLDEALRLGEAAVQIAEQIGHRESMAFGLRAKANALHFLGQNKAATELHKQALMFFERAGNAPEAGRTLSASIQPLILLGDYNHALSAARRAHKLFCRTGDKLRLARLQINTGNIFHRQDRLSAALACYQSAYTQLVPLKDTEGVVSSLHNTAVCLIGLNDFRKATATYERAREVCEKHHMPLAVVQADYNIAYLYYLRGHYSLAIQLLTATRAHAEAAGDAYHAALCHLDLADVYLELNLIDEAAETAQEAFLRFGHLGMRYEAAKALTNVACAKARRGELQEARESLSQAKSMFAEEGNRVWPALIDLYDAAVLIEQGEFQRARGLCLKALKSFAAPRLPNRIIMCRLLLARADYCMGDLEFARRECRRALHEALWVDSPSLTFQAQLLTGKIHEADRQYGAAFTAYKNARELLEILRNTLHQEDLKIAFLRQRVEVYERLVHICVRRRSSRSAEEAFGYIEDAKSRSLRDLLSLDAHSRRACDSGSNQSATPIRELREALNWCYHRIEVEQLSDDPTSPARCRALETLAHSKEAELVRTLREMPDSQASGGEVNQPANVTVADVRSMLPADAALVEFFRLGNRFLAMVITRDRLEIIPVGKASSVSKLAALLQFQLSKVGPGAVGGDVATARSLRVVRAHLRALYEELWSPIRAYLTGRRLIIVPHDFLHYLPFHALFDGKRYVIDRYIVSYAPSASVFVMCSRRMSSATGRSLVLGVPDPRAPSILAEVEAISAILPDADLFVGAAADEDKFRKLGPSSSLIHIATHAYFRQDNPLFSGIRLGTSYLTLLDLYGMNLSAQLVTLSGCATGMSVVTGGDELLGLARGFLTAGSESLVLTLWNVHDESTSLFMKFFYRRLPLCGDKAAALQGATIELRELYPHPYYWAPFVQMGKSSN